MMKTTTFLPNLIGYFLLMITLNVSAQTNSTLQDDGLAKRILITAPTIEQLKSIQDSGLDLHCGAKFEGEDLRLDLQSSEALKIQELGLSFQIIEDDLVTFFAQRAAATLPQARIELEQMKQEALIAQQNRNSLSTGDASVESFIQREACDEIDWVAQNFRLGGFNEPGVSFGGCLTVDEVNIELDRMRSLFPHLISIRQDASITPSDPTAQTTYGNTTGPAAAEFDPQTIWYVRISDNPDQDEMGEPESLITGMTHAREVNSMMNIIYYMWWILENYDTEPAVKNLVDNQEMYFIPIVNPDGVRWNQAITPNGGGFQRKNLRPGVNDNGNVATNNALRGVDLNRNSSYYWGFDNSGSSPNQTVDTYRGPSPASEPESQILAEFVRSRDFEYAINHHSGINSIVTSSYNGDPNAGPSGRENEYQKLMHDATRFNRYIHGSAPNTLTSANGDTNDFMLGGPDVTYNTFIDDDGDNFGNPATLQSYTAMGSGENIITFSPENGGDFWPPATDIVPIAQRAVRMNLMASLFAGKYARLHDFTTTNLTSTNPQLDFQVERLGQTASDLTLTITPISANITGITQPDAAGLNGLAMLEQRATSATLTLDPAIQVNDPVEYMITLSNDAYIIYEIIYTKYYSPTVVTTADGDTDWSLTGTWAETTDGFDGSTNAITSTPTPPYGNNQLGFATLNTVSDLSGANSAVVHFHAKWDLERNFDLAQLEVSTNGGSTWSAVCGKYSKIPSEQQFNLHLNKNNSDEQHQSVNGTFIYDGDLVVDLNATVTTSTADDTDKWVLEEFLFDTDNNPGIAGQSDVRFRFKFDTDSTNREDGYDTNFEGFTFDNFQVSIIDQMADICSEVIREFPQTTSLEIDEGLWMQNTDDDGNWTLDTNGTPSGSTGPDAGEDGGQYLYLEASDPAAVGGTAIGFGATAILTSPCLDLTGLYNLELSFLYHMFGDNTGSLQVEVLPNGGTVWQVITDSVLTGQQQTSNDADWLTQRINLNEFSNQVIQLRIVGTTGPDLGAGAQSFRSDIAIDNILISTPCANTTTYTSAGWSRGEPDANTTAIIADDYATSMGNLTACTVVINSGITVTVGNDEFISVENNMIVNGTLIVENEGSIVQVDDRATTSNNGTIEIRKTTPLLAPRDFVVLGTPMSAETRTEVYGAANRVFEIETALFTPDPAVTSAINFVDIDFNYFTPSTNLLPGEGFLVFPQAANATGNVNFDHTYTLGTLNSGTINYPLVYNGPATANNFNLLGNPYASAIDNNILITENAQVSELYFWEHLTQPNDTNPGANTLNFSMDDISIYNLVGGIAAVNGGTAPGQFMVSGQGFGILADQTFDGTAFIFNNGQRVTGNNGTVRSPEQEINRLWLRLDNATYTLQSISLIGFTPDATAAFDSGFDSERLATTISLFSTSEDDLLSIQAREAFDTSIEIGLGFSTLIPEEEDYTISIDNLEGLDLGNSEIFLIDNALNTITNLWESEYTFTASESIQTARFTLIFEERVLSTDDNSINQNAISLFPNPVQDQVTLSYTGAEQLNAGIITDINGKVIKTLDLSSFNNTQLIDISTFSTGIYFVQIQSKNSSVVKKLIVQ